MPAFEASMFSGFSDRDFDSYVPNKWRSNVFNRERLEVKQKLLALGRELAGALVAADGSPLTCEASSEHPALWNHKQVEAQHLFFSRNEGARKELDRIIDRSRPMASMLEDPTPQRNHLFLCVSIDHLHVDLALKLHPDARVDRQNLERKLAEPWEQGRFLELCRGLPEGYELGVTNGAVHDARRADDTILKAVLGELARPELPGKAHWLTIHRTVSRADAVAKGGELGAHTASGLAELLPLYHFIAWSRDNDFVSMREVLQKDKQARKQKGLARNDRIRVVRGVFAGRAGVVQEVDAKGALKVLVGTIVLKLGADEVEKG